MRHSLAGIVLSRLVGTRFQSLFTPLMGVLFTFPSRYWFTIGHQVVFSLGRWSSLIPTGLLGSRGTWDTASRRFDFTYRAVTLFGRPFQAFLLSPRFSLYLCRPTTPSCLSTSGLGSSPFARHYWGNLG